MGVPVAKPREAMKVLGNAREAKTPLADVGTALLEA
jgi:hypothetical protein